MSSADARTATTRREASGLRRAFQVLAGLTVVNVLVQFITAGQLFPNGGPEEVHACGAIVLHVLSGLAAVAAVLRWRQQRTTALAVVVSGTRSFRPTGAATRPSGIHVPGARLLTVGVVWVLFTSLRPGTTRAAR